MSMNRTPMADRVHIGIFGRSNVGKSSLINAITGQEKSIVSPIAGTTTDPVSKTMELLPLGPVVFVDTPGLDDQSELGKLRIQKALEMLERIDVALLVTDLRDGKGELERSLEAKFQERHIPYLTVYNKSDFLENTPAATEGEIWVSAKKNSGIRTLREKLAAFPSPASPPAPIVRDLLTEGDLVILVIPIDSAAPKGRLILPQQQTLREILDHNAQAIVTKETGLKHTLAGLSRKPKLVITDSQAFQQVAETLPRDIPLTSFSILFARHNGVLRPSVEGVNAVSALRDGSHVLIAEGCTHHRQCEDIGTVKLPRWLEDATGKKLNFSFVSGGSFPEDLTPYALVVHCGGCMLQPRVVQRRLATAQAQHVPITNYGILIAYLKGILPRSLEPLGE